ncbi:glycoside hydrolase 5 family protein [Aegicerativicinus sediminis]|uniref:hypothetical protein n=1 Tax=Aegicerativicinus sediminis TaxID=2893202 RepID=UPI001E4D9A2E|nr:hypothetical protein [Aegicerativicinus sediminis]
MAQNSEKVYVEDNIIKWSDSNSPLSLFGANYCLPSACDYRAASYYSKDLKGEIVKDMSHFVRMGWDGLRLGFWGDFENTDFSGNLINNVHLDLLDYLIYQADKRDIKMLLSPIITYSSQWPDAMEQEAIGFSTHFKKSELGTNPLAIDAQKNYLTQLLNHINPYTKRAIKDEPNILFIEMINEPWHHSDDLIGSVNYINSLVDAVRKTGCEKILFHNVSQDFNISEALSQSDIDGVTFAWYPTGLVSNQTLKANYLPTVDNYDLMIKSELKSLPRIVYEFDQPDALSPTMYPAMIRTFRSVGAQFAAIFSYDMLVSAKANLGWQTHFINLVYTPQKAVSSIIAAEAMRKLPLYKKYGNYPANTNFDDFRISHEECLSEYVSDTKFLYAGNTKSVPPKPNELKKIIGFGSSPIVKYTGEGSYFIEKIKSGVWRLEIYPDAVLTKDPFKKMSPDKIVSRLLYKNHSMEINLPDLGKEFSVIGVNEGNDFEGSTYTGKVLLSPGIYTITKQGIKIIDVPVEKIDGIPYRQFIVPAQENLALEIVHSPSRAVYSSKPLGITAKIVDDEKIDSVNVYFRPKGSWFRSFKMEAKNNYDYEVEIPKDVTSSGYYDYVISVFQGNNVTTFPSELNKTPRDWDFYSDKTYELEVIDEKQPLSIFSPKGDLTKLTFTRIGDDIRSGIFTLSSSEKDINGIIKLKIPFDLDKNLEDYSFSLYVGDQIKNLTSSNKIKGLSVNGMGKGNAYVTLIESDGTPWTAKIPINSEWESKKILLSDFKMGKGIMLPQGFPGNWNYWLNPSDNRNSKMDTVNMEKVEKLQISIRPDKNKNGQVEIGSISVIY